MVSFQMNKDTKEIAFEGYKGGILESEKPPRYILGNSK